MTDIRHLVERVAEALGPDVSPARVEAVAAAVLDAVEPALPRPAHSAEHVILTAYGLDKPGILSAITEAVSGAGCNILDVSQKILQGYFTLIMLADTGPMKGSLRDLQQRLADVGQRIQVRVLVQNEELFNAMHRP